MKKILILCATLLMLHGCITPPGYNSWSEYCEENPGICILIGVLIVGGVALIADSASDGSSTSSGSSGDEGEDGDGDGDGDGDIVVPAYQPRQDRKAADLFDAVMKQGLTLQADLRVIRDVRFAKTLENGLRLHAFRYLGSDDYFVGVLAHEIAQDPKFAHAIVKQENGLLAVDYKKLGVRLIRPDVMKAASDRAVAAY